MPSRSASSSSVSCRIDPVKCRCRCALGRARRSRTLAVTANSFCSRVIALDQVVVAERVGEPQVAGRAERLAGHDRHLGLLEDVLGQLGGGLDHAAVVLLAEQPLDRRVGVERAAGHRADHAVDLVEHRRRSCAGAGRRPSSSPRPRRGRPRPRRAPPAGRRWRRWRWRATAGCVAALTRSARADHPADPPAGHRVGLGDPVDDHAVVGEVRGTAPASSRCRRRRRPGARRSRRSAPTGRCPRPTGRSPGSRRRCRRRRSGWTARRTAAPWCARCAPARAARR